MLAHGIRHRLDFYNATYGLTCRTQFTVAFPGTSPTAAMVYMISDALRQARELAIG